MHFTKGIHLQGAIDVGFTKRVKTAEKLVIRNCMLKFQWGLISNACSILANSVIYFFARIIIMGCELIVFNCSCLLHIVANLSLVKAL